MFPRKTTLAPSALRAEDSRAPFPPKEFLIFTPLSRSSRMSSSASCELPSMTRSSPLPLEIHIWARSRYGLSLPSYLSENRLISSRLEKLIHTSLVDSHPTTIVGMMRLLVSRCLRVSANC